MKMKELQDLPLSPPDEIDVTEFVDNYTDEKLKEPVTEDDILSFGEWIQTAGDDFDTIRKILLLVLNAENPDPQAAGEWIIGMMKAYRRGKAGFIKEKPQQRLRPLRAREVCRREPRILYVRGSDSEKEKTN